MKNNLTEVVFILDRSGSMGGLEQDTIGGFNSLLEKQKKEAGTALVTTILFDNRIETLHDRKNIADIAPITEKDYFVRGSTALLDAIGQTIDHIKHIHRYARPEDVPAKTLFIITTDGMENSSHSYSAEKVKQLIEHEKEKYGWEFLFLGANIDAVETAAHFGISKDYAVDYLADAEGTSKNFDAMSEAVSAVRCCSAPLSPKWKESIEADFRTRSTFRRSK